MSDEPVSLPGLPAMVDHAGEQALRILADCPRAADAALVARAFATTAVHHSASGEPGGSFRLLIQAHPGRARVEVTDQGDPGAPVDDPGYSSRLRLVDRLADRWGHERKPGESVWFADLEWADDEEEPCDDDA